MKKIALILSLVAVAQLLLAQPTAFQTLALPDSLTQATVVVHQDSVMQQAIEFQQTNRFDLEKEGFRVQLFSSNNVRSAREEAFKVEKEVLAKLPNMSVYVTYMAPFWRVRVGNCHTKEDAQRLRQFLIEQLPQYATGTYVVRDLIKLNQ